MSKIIDDIQRVLAVISTKQTGLVSAPSLIKPPNTLKSTDHQYANNNLLVFKKDHLIFEYIFTDPFDSIYNKYWEFYITN